MTTTVEPSIVTGEVQPEPLSTVTPDSDKAQPGEAAAVTLAAGAAEQPPKKITAKDAKAELDAFKAKVRQVVLRESDRNRWCDNGTRDVCNELRVARAGDKTQFKGTVTWTVTAPFNVRAYTTEGLQALMEDQINTTRGWGSDLKHTYGEVTVSVTETVKAGEEEEEDTDDDD